MAGLTSHTPVPCELTLHQQSRRLELRYDNGQSCILSHEFLRVFSPSAEVRGHGVGQEVLQVGKRDVTILRIEPVGNYAIKPVFSDAHDSGLYSWDILYFFCQNHEELWENYLKKLSAEGQSRDPADYPPPTEKMPPSCGVRR